VAKTQFHVEVLTPEGSVFDDEVEMVSTRTEVGSIGILARHQPLLGTLVPTEQINLNTNKKSKITTSMKAE